MHKMARRLVALELRVNVLELTLRDVSKFLDGEMLDRVREMLADERWVDGSTMNENGRRDRSPLHDGPNSGEHDGRGCAALSRVRLAFGCALPRAVPQLDPNRSPA
jgi:hypothetical protein